MAALFALTCAQRSFNIRAEARVSDRPARTDEEDPAPVSLMLMLHRGHKRQRPIDDGMPTTSAGWP